MRNKMVAEPAISSMRVFFGAPRALIEHRMRKHIPSSVEELARICGGFFGAGAFSSGIDVLRIHLRLIYCKNEKQNLERKKSGNFVFTLVSF
jgi:hypothetical protein